MYERRDGAPLWCGPPDPLAGAAACDLQHVQAFRAALAKALAAHGGSAVPFEVDDELGLRLVFRFDGQPVTADPAQDERLCRPSLHGNAIDSEGLSDPLAARGDFLVALGCVPVHAGDAAQPCLELPQFTAVAQFQQFLGCAEQAAQRSGLATLVWRGFPPPVDSSVAWTTLTPDPAVMEINQAPAAGVAEFLAANRALYALAADEGLAPYRLQYNGTVSDSGGGGQFTLGGPAPAESPFFASPHLLARLIRYLNRHPSLSYWLAPAYVGSSSQAPRPDEGVPDSFRELGVALQQLERVAAPKPEFIWRTLHPFLVDPSGNTHRSELNIEKLWNPFLPDRGRLKQALIKLGYPTEDLAGYTVGDSVPISKKNLPAVRPAGIGVGAGEGRNGARPVYWNWLTGGSTDAGRLFRGLRQHDYGAQLRLADRIQHHQSYPERFSGCGSPAL